MKRIDDFDGAIIEGDISVEDYIAKAPDVPSPTWVTRDELGSTRMLGHVLWVLLIVGLLAPPIIRALAQR